MNGMALEWKKLRRTGLLPASLAGGALAAAAPIVQTAVRGAGDMGLTGLLSANWQLMAMLNVLMAVAGACILYSSEYADDAIRRMRTLPVRESTLFLGKCAVLAMMCALMLALEAVSIGFCCMQWLGDVSVPEVLRNFGFFFLLMLPAVCLSLLIASAFSNMWISLGIGVVCVFLATILPAQNFALSCFPFCLPFQRPTVRWAGHMAAAILEALAICALEVGYLKLRREFT